MRSDTVHPSPSVIIVGGGLAGMSAAIGLHQKGFRVRILESRRRLGGRVGSFEDAVSDKSLDYCQHVGMACCTNLDWFLRELNIDSFWQRERVLHFFSSTGKHLPVQASALPAPLHLSGLLGRWPGISRRDRLQIAWGLWKLMRLKSVESLDEQLAIQWLRSIGQREEVIARFWSTILVSALGDQINRVTLGATRKVLIDGFAANREAYNLLVPRQPLSEIIGEHGGQSLEARGIQIEYGITIDHCTWMEGRCQSVVSREGTQFTADHFVFAVPWHRISRLIEEHCEVDSVSKLQSAPITGVHTWWDRSWLEPPHAILVDRLCQWVFKEPIENKSLHRNNFDSATDRNEHYYQVVISGSRDLPKGDSNRILELVAEDLAAVFPEAARARLLRGRVVTDPNSVFSVSPGHQKSRFAADHFAKNNLWLAGDWTDTQWPATMEGAIRSGLIVANRLGESSINATSLHVADLPKGWLSRWLIA